MAVEAGGYRVEKVLTELNGSRTYLAKGNAGLVFLKELIFALAPDERSIAAFTREAELLRQLHHPAIPDYIASFSEGEGSKLRLYLVERFVEGMSLEAELATHRYSEKEIRDLAKEVLSVLIYLHERTPPVLHRDLKPANLLRATSGQLMLVDFGSARDAAVQPSPGVTASGTFGYAAPEQLSGLATVRSDLYGLGATLAHLLSRRPPWEMLTVGLGIDVSSVKISPSLKRWLRQLVHVSPQERFVDARQALASLEKPERRSVPGALLGGAALLSVLAAGSVGLRAGWLRYRESTRVYLQGGSARCPPDAVLAGSPPPLGTEQFCVLDINGVPTRHGPSLSWGAAADSLQLSTYNAGILDGPFETTGVGKNERGQYVAGKKTGRWLITWDDGAATNEGEFVEGRQSGEWVEAHRRPDKSFAVLKKGSYRDGLMSGLWTTYFKGTTQKESEINYVDGKRNGLMTESFSSGARVETQMLNDLMDGRSTRWHPNGQISSVNEYAGGKKNGMGADFLEDGTKGMETHWSAGRPVGAHLIFGPDGKLVQKTLYGPTGAPLAHVEFDPQGARTKEATLFTGDTLERVINGIHITRWSVVAFYPDGTKKFDCMGEPPSSYSVRLSEGPCVTWYPSGVKQSEGQLNHSGDRFGVWNFYSAKGTLTNLTTFGANEILDGHYEDYFENGRVKLSGNHEHGRRVGVWVDFGASGKVVRRTDWGSVKR